MEMQVNNTKKMGRPMIADPDYNSARARKMEADADLAELELLQAKKELLSANDVLNSWTEVLAAMRAKMLSLPTVTAPLVANETDIGAIQHIIEKQIHEALNELTPRERLIIFRRRLNDEGATLEQLGGTLGVSKERVRQLEHRALKKLRVSLEANTDMPLDLLPQLP